jgi:lipoyl(octanoyl) transferase
MSEINASPEFLLDLGISIYETDRGGQVTYHGPGQLIAYPIIDIRSLGGPLKYVRTLEQIIIKTLSDYNIKALTNAGFTGVWVSDKKIAAIGVKISRGIALHGISLNINPDLSYFEHIIPCGLLEAQITSMENVLDKQMDMDTVSYSLQYHLGKELGLTLIDSDPEELPTLD